VAQVTKRRFAMRRATSDWSTSSPARMTQSTASPTRFTGLSLTPISSSISG
jgi:hypothetical protein